MTRRRWIAVGLIVALLLAALAAAAGWWYRERTVTKNVVGSSTVEFVPHAKPKPRPPKVVEQTPWPTFGYDGQRTHQAPFKLRPPFRRLWVFRSGNLLEYPPVVTQDYVVGTQELGRAFAVDKHTGKAAWSHEVGHCAASSPVVVGQIVYAAFMQPRPCRRYPRTQRGLIIAYRLGDGKELWRKSVPVVESSLLYVDGLLYYGGWDGAVYALDARTRRIRWRSQTDGEVDGSAAYASKTVFVGNNAGSIYAFDAATGAVRWRSHSSSGLFRGREYFYATPTVAYGRVYASNTDGAVYAFGATTGNLLWERRAGTYVYTPPAVWDNKVYVGTYDGRFVALDAATGEVVWSYDAPAVVHGAPVVMDGLVYFSTCGICGSNAVRYVKTGPSLMIALDARTGKEVWRFHDGTYSPLVADAKQVYLVGRSWIYGVVPRP